MITGVQTIQPRSVADLVKETGLELYVVAGVLLNLGNRGLVRRIDQTENVWEISHDFVARLLGNLLRPSPVARVRPYVALAMVAAGCVAAVAFFMHGGGTGPPPKAADVYAHPSGSFERQGEMWVEYPPYAPGRNFRFKETGRDDQFIYLYDETRHQGNDPVRVFYLRIPVSGGWAEWSYPNPLQWQQLYFVTPKTK